MFKNMFKNNNIYNASNDNWDLHWGSNITGINFRAYPDVKDTTYRNSNANIMFSHLFGYRIYLKHWFTSSQVSTQEVAVNGKRLKISFVWLICLLFLVSGIQVIQIHNHKYYIN